MHSRANFNPEYLYYLKRQYAVSVWYAKWWLFDIHLRYVLCVRHSYREITDALEPCEKIWLKNQFHAVKHKVWSRDRQIIALWLCFSLAATYTLCNERKVDILCYKIRFHSGFSMLHIVNQTNLSRAVIFHYLYHLTFKFRPSV